MLNGNRKQERTRGPSRRHSFHSAKICVSLEVTGETQEQTVTEMLSMSVAAPGLRKQQHLLVLSYFSNSKSIIMVQYDL